MCRFSETGLKLFASLDCSDSEGSSDDMLVHISVVENGPSWALFPPATPLSRAVEIEHSGSLPKISGNSDTKSQAVHFYLFTFFFF